MPGLRQAQSSRYPRFVPPGQTRLHPDVEAHAAAGFGLTDG
jgi:hypothetical protein